MAITLKPITVRLPEEDLELARKEAEALGVGVGVYLRMLFRQSLRGSVAAKGDRQARADALRRFAEVMADEVEGLEEGDAVRLAKGVRKRLAAERRGGG